MEIDRRTRELEARLIALEKAMGALVMLAMQQAAPPQRPQLAEGLSLLARAAEKEGDLPSAQLLTALHGAAAFELR